MIQQKCEYCQGELVTVKGELICTNCGLINKSSLENKERYISPIFYQERKLKQQRLYKQKRNLIYQIKSDLAYMINYLEISTAVEKQAYGIILDILGKERRINPDFPWHQSDDNLNFNCLIALSIIVSINKIMGNTKLVSKVFRYFQIRGEELAIDDIKEFINNLSSGYDYLEVNHLNL